MNVNGCSWESLMLSLFLYLLNDGWSECFCCDFDICFICRDMQLLSDCQCNIWATSRGCISTAPLGSVVFLFIYYNAFPMFGTHKDVVNSSMALQFSVMISVYGYAVTTKTILCIFSTHLSVSYLHLERPGHKAHCTY